MDPLMLARWQFAITTVYHFFFVPLTIGLAPLVAVMQTIWYRTGQERWLKLTKFFGKLLLINFSLGLVTGIVQEFQFGMNWSEYSRFVGDVFGAPLAMEALAAFFVESVFLGLWIFGWDRLTRRAHLVSIWLFAIAVNLSAFFILAANSWMQHPVGTVFANGRAEMESIWAVLTNRLLIIGAFPHTIAASFVVAGTFVMGIAIWWMVRLARSGRQQDLAQARNVYRPAVRLGAWVTLVSGILLIGSGDAMGRLLVEEQPFKMAAAEALCETEAGAAFTIAAFGAPGAGCYDLVRLGQIPGMFSFLATHDFNGVVPGTENVQAEFAQRYGAYATNADGSPIYDAAGSPIPINYLPPLQTTFWSFRLMIGLGVFSAALALAALWLTRGGTDLSAFVPEVAAATETAPVAPEAHSWRQEILGADDAPYGLGSVASGVVDQEIMPDTLSPSAENYELTGSSSSARDWGVSDATWLKQLALRAIPMPFLASAFGWIFTEVGRQPWLVTPNPTGIDAVRLLTLRGVSTAVSGGTVLFSMIVFTLIYAVLAVAWFILMRRYIHEGLPQHTPVGYRDTPPAASEEVIETDVILEKPLSFAY